MELLEKGRHQTIRLHETQLVERLNIILRQNPFRYKYKNDLLVELIALGVEQKLKNVSTPTGNSKGGAPPAINADMAQSFKQLKQIIENMHVYNQRHIEGIMAHLKMSERLSAAMYNVLLAVATDKPVTNVQVEIGYYDDIPTRFEEYLNEQLKEIFAKRGDGQTKEYKS